MTEAATPQLALSAEFKGQALTEGDAGYDQARAVYNGSIDRRPALVVRPTGAADVIDAVTYARAAGLPLTVKGGGHSVAGTSANEGGVLIDLSSLKGVQVDPQRGTALAQGGVLWGEYDREALLYGLATPGGRVTTTGVGGFCLGGGYGWISGKHGLTCDNLVGATVVTADGRVVHTSEDENADLLWGLRGAGANFGVVTSFELRLHAIPALLLAGLLVLPNGDAAAEVMREFRAFCGAASEDVVCGVATLLAPPAPFVPPELIGQPMLGVVLAYIGDQGEAVEALAPIREVAAAAGGMDLVQPMPYTAFQSILDDFAPKGWLNYHRGLHLSDITDDIIEPFLEVGRGIHSPMTQGIIFHHGGAVSRVASDATAASNRDAPYMAHPIACWATPEEGAYELDWVSRFGEAVAPARTGRTYLNFEPGTNASDVRSGYGDAKYQRLVELKTAWDPTNLFRSNHNIPPEGWAAG